MAATDEIRTRWSGTREASFDNIETGVELGPMHITVTDQLIKAYAFSMDDYRPEHFGTSAIGHAALLANDMLNVKYGTYDRMTVVGLHTDEELIFHAPVPINETVTITGRYVEKRILRGQGHAVMVAEARDASGRLLVEHRNSELTRVDPGTATSAAGKATPSRKVDPTALNVEPVRTVRRDIITGTPIVGKVTTLTQAQMSVFSYAGEHEKNFHNDLNYAREHGLEGTIAQGLHCVGYFSDVCTGFFGAPWYTTGRLKTKFLLPVRPDSELRVAGKVIDQEVTRDRLRTHLDLWTHDHDGRLVSVGWALATTPLDHPPGKDVTQ